MEGGERGSSSGRGQLGGHDEGTVVAGSEAGRQQVVGPAGREAGGRVPVIAEGHVHPEQRQGEDTRTASAAPPATQGRCWTTRLHFHQNV